MFLVRPDDMANINQMIEAVSRDGYVIAQEYLTGAEEGDTRLFVMNGQPLRHKGRYAAFRRIRRGGRHAIERACRRCDRQGDD